MWLEYNLSSRISPQANLTTLQMPQSPLPEQPGGSKGGPERIRNITHGLSTRFN